MTRTKRVSSFPLPHPNRIIKEKQNHFQSVINLVLNKNVPALYPFRYMCGIIM